MHDMLVIGGGVNGVGLMLCFACGPACHLAHADCVARLNRYRYVFPAKHSLPIFNFGHYNFIDGMGQI